MPIPNSKSPKGKPLPPADRPKRTTAEQRQDPHHFHPSRVTKQRVHKHRSR